MKKIAFMLLVGAGVTLMGTAHAAEHQVVMLNKGQSGVMVFEPNVVRAAPGDTIRFIPTNKGHNAETIAGMLPGGAEPFKGKLSQEFAITVEKEGVYGIKCAPHYGMGMVALVVVGEAVNLGEAQAVKHPGKAKTTFAALLGQVVAGN